MKLSKIYEPEIDGLRAVAVLAVVLYHAELKGFSGGFIGVDIFFVISGYLITRNIISDLALKQFTFRDFYFRRARRIFPAMFVTMLLSAIAGFLIFSPLDIERLGASIVYASGAVSNIFFWKEAGYWDTSKNFKPLLHFWSLGVEEQFYLFWPFLLSFLYGVSGQKTENKNLFLFISFISLLSLLLAQYFLARDATAVFYLTPFRVFEFGVGALLLRVLPLFDHLSNRTKEICVLCGTAAIVFAVRRYSEQMPFPGITALLPCLGTALIIGARTARLTGSVFRNRLAVGLGLISYSLYLVHWPIFVFYKYYQLHEITKMETCGLVILSIVTAFFMYRFVEQPFRKARPGQPLFLKPAHFFMLMVFLLASLAAPAAYAWKNQGWAGDSREMAVISRNVQLALKERKKYLLGCLMARQGYCERSSAAKHFIVLGDSYGEDIAISLFNAYPDYKFFLNTGGGCKALLNSINDKTGLSERERCRNFYDKIFSGNNDWSQYDAVLLSMAWDEQDIGLLEPTIAYFKSHGAKRIIVVGPKIVLKIPVSQILARSRKREDFINISKQEMDFSGEQKIKSLLAVIARNSGVEFIDIATAECPDTECPNLVPGTLMPLIWDKGHWTVEGAKYVGRNAREKIKL